MTYTLLHRPTALKVSSRVQARLDDGELSYAQVQQYKQFLDKVNRLFLHHRIIMHNAYTHWFSQGLATDLELRHFIRQFSVFSNQFLVAALKKTINAPTLAQSRASRGGICRFRAAHLEWLLGVAEDVGLSFAEIGQRQHGRPRTIHFCDELIRLLRSNL